MGKKNGYIEEYVQINGINQYFLHYPSLGEGVVIFLHGGPGSSAMFQIHNLSRHLDFCNMVYYEQRGTGRTLVKNNTQPHDLTMDTLLDDLKETICYVKKKYHTDRVVLLGQSWGSILGKQYVLRYPEDVICYIGTGQSVDLRMEMKVAHDKLVEVVVQNGTKRDLKKLEAIGDFPNAGRDKYFGDMYRMGLLQTKHKLTTPNSSPISMILKMMIKSPVFKLRDIYLMQKGLKLNKGLATDLLEYSIWDVCEYRLPVYYILGESDWQVPSTLAAEYFEKINAPHKGLYWIENAGHATDVDNTKGFCSAVKEIAAYSLSVIN
ncbi:MAG: alpha/beta hydrolase [Defluviitaleaceae bacterium]|nr:alpha/beta hydrolase [Defluviitaleaceae bacterium]